MAIIQFEHKGSFKNTEHFFRKKLVKNFRNILENYGRIGVEALKNATPKDTGKTAESWSYVIEQGDGTVSLHWTNSNENKGLNIVVLLIYGHGLQNGSYVQGNDFVTPVVEPIFDSIAKNCWKEVIR